MELSSNPFATRFTGTGRLACLYDSASNRQALVDSVVAAGFRAAIVGPHGSGKTTLLLDLIPTLGTLQFVALPQGQVFPTCYHGVALTGSTKELESSQANSQTKHIRWFTCRRGDPAVATLGRDWRKWSADSLVVVDGYEQLTPLARLKILTFTKWRSCGLLVTGHRPTVLKTLITTRASAEIVQDIIQSIASTNNGCFAEIDRVAISKLNLNDLQRRLDRHAGNVREVLFELYDEFEASKKHHKGRGDDE